MTYRSTTALFSTMLVAAATAGAADVSRRTHRITPDDYFSIATITGVALSPDGTAAAYVEQRWEPPEATRNSDLWVVGAATGPARRLTFDRANEVRPALERRWGVHLLHG